MTDKATLRAWDFITACVLTAISLFFLWRTSSIPLFDNTETGVRIGGWYNSAALVPYGLFSALLVLALCLLIISIRDGGARQLFSAMGLHLDKRELGRLASLSSILFFYIYALVPRVDFILASALTILVMIYGYHRGNGTRALLATLIQCVAGAYSLLMHFPQAQWGKAHDDDVVTMMCWAIVCILIIAAALKTKDAIRTALIAPLLSLLVPLFLVSAMAFGFKQNIPNRAGLIFSKIEYHYYVTLLPAWRK